MGRPTEVAEWDVESIWVEGAHKAMAWMTFGWALIVATVLLLTMLALRIRTAWIPVWLGQTRSRGRVRGAVNTGIPEKPWPY
jgi:hypothetical protein